MEFDEDGDTKIVIIQWFIEMNNKLLQGCVLFSLLFAQPSMANLIGDTVSASAFGGSGSAVVTDPGVEFTFTAQNGETDTIDIFATSLVFTVMAPAGVPAWLFVGAPGGDIFKISGIDALPISSQLIGATFASSILSNGVTASNLTFFDTPGVGNGMISFEIQDLMANPAIASTWTVDLVFSQVPEPATTALLAIGLLGAAFVRKRRTH